MCVHGQIIGILSYFCLDAIRTTTVHWSFHLPGIASSWYPFSKCLWYVCFKKCVLLFCFSLPFAEWVHCSTGCPRRIYVWLHWFSRLVLMKFLPTVFTMTQNKHIRMHGHCLPITTLSAVNQIDFVIALRLHSLQCYWHQQWLHSLWCHFDGLVYYWSFNCMWFSLKGTAVVTLTKATLWTDSRYWVQAERQMDCNWELEKDGEWFPSQLH